MGTRKEFAGLGEAYGFFQQHSSEAEASRQAWLPLLPKHPARLLDFGCGPGDYLAELLKQIHPQNLCLVEPDPEFRQKAQQSLGSQDAWPELLAGQSFDCIVSHHVLYYVPDLRATLKQLWQALEPGGRMILAQGGKDNGLNQILKAALRPCPYYFSEDTAAQLKDLEIPHRVIEVEDACQFPDSQANRRNILRFLLGEKEGPLTLLDPFLHRGQILIPSRNQHFIVDRPG